MNSEKPTLRRVRLWPALLVVVLAFIALGALWAIPEMQHQQRNIRTALILFASGLLLLLWFLFFSRLRWRVRLSGFALLLLAVLGLRLTLRVRGVSGDFVPIVEPRWRARPMSAPAVATDKPAPKRSLEGEFTGFYGPQRNATLPGPELESDWAAHPPKVLWKQPIGGGWSGFAIKDGLAVTFEQRGDSEYVVCYEVLTGRTLWTHADQTRYASTMAGEGPRTTPTISGNRVYTFGATGFINCLDLESGKIVWNRNAAAENQAQRPDWGYAGSPLVLDGKVIVSVGGTNGRSLVAYSAADGKVVWSNGSGPADSSSPLEATLLGTRQILLFTSSVIARDLGGNELWSYPWPGGHPHITPPLVVSSNQLLVASGYGTGAELLEIERNPEGKWVANRLWKGRAPKSKFGPLFRVGDYVYGLDDGIFCCVELKTGERKWKDGRYGHGQGLLVGEQILLTTEMGDVLLIRPDPEKLVEVARFKVFVDKTWNPPALAGEYLLLRNDKEAACLELKRKKMLEKS